MKRLCSIAFVLMMFVTPVLAQETTPTPEVTAEPTPVVVVQPVPVPVTDQSDHTFYTVMAAFSFGSLLIALFGQLAHNRSMAGLLATANSGVAGTQQWLNNPHNAQVLHEQYTKASPSVQQLVDTLLKFGDFGAALIPGTKDDELIDRLEEIKEGKIAPTDQPEGSGQV